MKISLWFTHPWCILGLFDFLISDKSNRSYIKNRPGYSKRSPSGTRAASNATRNAISDIQVWIMCNQSKLTARHQVRVMSWPGSLKHVRCSRRQLSVIQQISLCVSVTYMFCESYLLLFVKVTQASKAPACQRHHLKLIRAKVDHVIDCVFLPAHVISRAGIHTVCAWSAWEWSTQSWLLRGPAVRIVSGYHCVHFAPGGFSSRREPSPAFLALLGSPPLRRSGGCIRGVRSWIWQMEWRRTGPYLRPLLPDPLPVLWDRKPVLRFLPLREWTQRFSYLPPRGKMWRSLIICPFNPPNMRSY